MRRAAAPVLSDPRPPRPAEPTPVAVDRSARAPGRLLLPLFALATFLGAFLLFWIQPLFAKAVLPLLGGSPGVWNTALVFFQGALLGGYLYAHLTSRHLGRRPQVALHLVVLAVAFVALPVAVPEGWTPPASGVPGPWLLGLLAVAIGLPFFAVSATAPLVQRWFADTGHPEGEDPYFLYSASNLGSLVALLAFPVLLEPFVGLERQGRLWTWGYGGLVLLLAACAAAVWRRARPGAPGSEASAKRAAESPGRAVGGGDSAAGGGRGTDVGRGTRPDGRPDATRRLRWLLLAFVPSSLLLGVTSHISTDLASFPLLWVVPLVLYLLTYILAFARRPPIPHGWMLRTQPYLLVLLALALTWGAAQRLLLFNILLHLGAFFVIALVCHRELAELRPGPGRLTEFYVWLSLGGVLGGAFTALAAPVLFDSVLEYPLVVVLAAMLRPAEGKARPEAADLFRPAVLLSGAWLLVFLLGRLDDPLGTAGPPLVVGLMALPVFGFARRPVRFGLGLGALFLVGFHAFETDPVLERERSFFGVHRVAESLPGPRHLLFHGTTLHGIQSMAPGKRRTPLLYYAEATPVGQVFQRLGPQRRVGVVGLGTGALACYSRPGEEWTFYEIDPTVERIARDTALFHYLGECGRDVEVVLGDGRLSLRREPGGAFDLLILDAFSSDAIPVHLLTVEAMELYASRLAPDGLLLLHISNRYLDLQPVVANVVTAAGLVGRGQYFAADGPLREASVTSSTWVIVAHDASGLAFLDGDDRWEPLGPDPGIGTWTDDFSNILEVLDIWGS